MISKGSLRWESVAEQTRLKQEAQMKWSRLKRFSKLVFVQLLKEKNAKQV